MLWAHEVCHLNHKLARFLSPKTSKIGHDQFLREFILDKYVPTVCQ